jgi:autotransporter-associated beta strand protein
LVLNSNNTYVGTTVVDDGTLQVNGYQPDSPILLNRVTLAGKGTVGSVTSGGTSAKILNPGLPLAAAILTCSNLTLSGTTSFQVELNGTTPGSGYDQLVVNGSVSLNNATFAGAVGFAPAPGDSFVIINNDGNDPVNGIFLGLTNGAPLVLGTNLFQISYTGGDGNDVVLTRIRMPARFESLTQLPNGQEQIRATGGFAGLTYTVQAAPSLNPVIQWSNLGTATANASGVIVFTDTNAPLFPMRFYRALSP